MKEPVKYKYDNQKSSELKVSCDINISEKGKLKLSTMYGKMCDNDIFADTDSVKE